MRSRTPRTEFTDARADAMPVFPAEPVREVNLSAVSSRLTRIMQAREAPVDPATDYTTYMTPTVIEPIRLPTTEEWPPPQVAFDGMSTSWQLEPMSFTRFGAFPLVCPGSSPEPPPPQPVMVMLTRLAEMINTQINPAFIEVARQMNEWVESMMFMIQLGPHVVIAEHTSTLHGAPMPDIGWRDELDPYWQRLGAQLPPTSGRAAEFYGIDPYAVLSGEHMPDGDLPPTGAGDPLADVYGAFDRTMADIDRVLAEDA